jgi:arylsulfatase A-like enzyme
MHEGGIRAPMLARWPGVVAPGKSTKHISGFQDVLPTICELVGQPVPRQNDGISFLPTLRGETKSQQAHDYLYFEFCKGLKQKIFSQAIRMGDWKAYRQAGKPLELFNLAKDPFEKSNLAKANLDLSHKMADLMKQAHAPLPVQN